MKKRIVVAVLCALLAFSTFGIVACKKKTNVPTVTLVDWQDETIEVGLHDDVTLSTDAVYDTNGNAYATTAVVKTKSGDTVAVIGGKFTADYAGGYIITYSLFDITVQAKPRVVTVNIKDSETPVPYFEHTALVAYENTAFAVPTYGVSIDPNYTAQTTLKLYKVTGSGNETTRTEVTDQTLSGNITLPAGNYVFVLTAVAGEKTGTAELVFRVRYLDEMYAISTLDSAAEINIGTSFWANSKNDWDARAVTFKADAARENALSFGAAVVTLPGEASESYFSVTPSISRADFVEAMGLTGARISVWLKITSENHNRHTVRYGDFNNRKSVTLDDGEWGNLLIAKEEFGTGNDLDALYDKLIGSAGNHTNTPFSVLHADGGSYTVAVDSIYVAQPVTATLADKTVAQGATDTLQVTCAETSEFVYTVYDLTSATDTPQVGMTGQFTFDVAGKIEATALPYRNRFYTPAPIRCDVTVTAGNFAFGDSTVTIATAGKQTVPAMASGSIAATGYKIVTTDGNANYAYVDNGQIRVFKGNYKLYAFAENSGVHYSTYVPVTCTNDDETKSNGDIATFNNPKDLDYTNANEASLYSYVGDYEGASGVVKYGAGAWSQLRLTKSVYDKAALTMQGFTDNDFLVIRLRPENIVGAYYVYFTHAYAMKYTSDAGADNGFTCGDAEHQTANRHDTDVAYLMADVWQDVYVPAKEFLTYYGRFIGWTNADGGAGFCFGDNGANTADIYVDSIRLVKAASDTSNIALENKKVEFNAFTGATDFAAVAKANRKAGGGAPVLYEAGSGEHTGLVSLRTYTDEQWPTFGIVARAPKSTYTGIMSDGAGWTFNMAVKKRMGYATPTIGIEGLANDVKNKSVTGEWTTVKWDANLVLPQMTADGVVRFVLAADGNAIRYDVAIDKIWFEQAGIPVSVNANGVLTAPSTATITVNSTNVGTVSGNNKTYDLKNSIPQETWGSQDVAYTVSQTGFDNVSGTWSSPAAANEINGFGSNAAKNNFTANPASDCAVSVIAEHNGRKGVAKIECRKDGDDANWANFCIGAPMLTAAQASVYTANSNAFIELDVCASESLTIDFRIGANIIEAFPLDTTWKTVRIPVEYYNAEHFADGTAFFNVSKDGNNLRGKTVYIDSIKFGTHTSIVQKTDTRYDLVVVAEDSKVDFANRTTELTYVTGQTLGDVTGVSAFKLEETGSWPTIGNLLPRASKDEYETWFGDKLSTGKFIIQLYNDGAADRLSIQGFTTDNIDYVITSGWNTVAIDASILLNNWAKVTNGGKFVPCVHWDAQQDTDQHKVYFTGFYFAKDAEVAGGGDKMTFIDFSSATAKARAGTSGDDAKYAHYVESVTLGGQSISGALRFKATGSWPTLQGFVPCFTKEQYTTWFGDGLSGGKLVVKLYNAGAATTLGFKPNGDNTDAQEPTIGSGWQTVKFDVGALFEKYYDVLSSKAQIIPCVTYPGQKDTDEHDVYFTEMYFEKASA